MNERRLTVQENLEGFFKRYGLPEEMLTDNGNPWGHDVNHPHTKLTV